MMVLGLSSCASTASQKAGRGPSQNATAHATTNPYLIPSDTKVTPGHMVGRTLVRVALLAPFTSDNPAIRNEAQALQSAAELALFEHGDGSMLLIPKDSGDTPETARAAAIEAISSGADFILGPLFASGVSAIAPYSRANNVAMFSFSTDTSEAGRTIYVFTFLPEDEARKIVRFAAQRGVKRLVILAPEGRYGDRISAAASETALNLGIKLIAEQRYDPRSSAMNSAVEAAKRVGRLLDGANDRQTAVLIPERGPDLRTIIQTLTETGATSRKIRYLGTGLWNDAETLSEARMEGAWFVTPDLIARRAFEARFNATYQRRATRLAGIGYDATAMLARMTRGGNKNGASARAIEARDGFEGVDGVFRFTGHVVERGMAVNEISARGSKTVQEAPKSFQP
jgi:ABC-type branched-subunit amino acid transport system substrate-binding protein